MITFLKTARSAMLLGLAGILMLAGLAATAGVSNTYAQSAGEGAPATLDQPAGTAIWMGMMDVEWNEVPGAETYEVQYFNMSGWADLPGNGIRIAFYGAGAVVRGLSPSSSYTFRVRAVNSHGASDWSSFGWVPQTDGPSAWRNVPEPANVAATGVPTISGTMETGETLTADVSDISDENGLGRVKFHYQWMRSDGTTDADIEGATEASYSLTKEDEGKTIEVRVSFTDRHGFSERLLSEATDTVHHTVGQPQGAATTSAPAAEANEETTSNTSNAPEFPGATTTRSVAENSDTSTLVGLPVAATDSEDTSLTYSIEGEAADALTVDAAGQLRVAEGAVLDHESRPTLIGTVTATDSAGATASIEVTVTVTDVNDPNIVVIMADDAGYEVFGPYGSEQYPTPRLDEIASKGARFDNAFAKPLCTPSRSAIMTGKSNVRSYNNWITMASSTYTFGDLFGDAGYATAIAGKWQLHGSYRLNGPYATKQAGGGFDTYCLWDTLLTGGESTSRYWEPTVECDGSLIATDAEDYGPDIFVDFLLDFMETNQRRPFFAYYPMVLPHQPFVEPPDASCELDEGNSQCPYEKMVARVDHNVGRIYDKLRTLGLIDNTLLLFTTDNGTPRSIVSELGGETIYGGKAMTTDGGTRVPLVAHVPGQSEGRVVDDLVDIVDILPTVAEAAGIELPSDQTFDGVSFWEQLQGNEGTPREWIYTYYWPQPFKRNHDRPVYHPEISYARDKVYKLYSTGELFNVAEDGLELYPLPADDAASAEARSRLQAVLDSMFGRGWELFLLDRGFGSMPDGSAQRPRLRPVLRAASVAGDELTLSYVGLVRRSPLPPVTSFTVLVDGDEVPVSEVRIAEGDASIVTSGITEVTLVLESEVAAGQDVTVSYVPGPHPIRIINTTGSPKAAPLSDRAVVNIATNSPSAGQPGIRGSGFFGNTLLAITSDIMDADGLANVAYSYQWLLSDNGTDTEIEGADQVNYRLRSSEERNAIKVRVSFTDDAGHDETLTSAPVALYQPTALTARASEGSVVLTWDPPEEFPYLFNYRIFRQRPERGETEPLLYADTGRSPATTYTDSNVEPGALYIYRVQATQYRNRLSLLSGPVEIRTLAGNTAATGQPTISGTDGVPATPDQPTGRAIWAGMMDVEWNEVPGAEMYEVQYFNMSGWADLPGDGIEIAFYGAGAVVSGLKSSSSYTFRVRAVNSHGASDWSSFGWVPQTDGPPAWVNVPEPTNVPATGAPVFNGNREVGDVLTVDTSGIFDENGLDRVKFHYQWIRSDGTTDTDIEGATGRSYTLTEADEGKTIKVRVWFTDRHGFPEALIKTAKSNHFATGVPTINGEAWVGETLTADTADIQDEDGLTDVKYEYQWVFAGRRGKENIEGAASATYTLTEPYLSKAIRVRVTFTDDIGNEESLISEGTAEVAWRPNNPATGAPTIGGTPEVLQALTAHTSSIGDEDGLDNVSFEYQWVAIDGGVETDIPGATKANYTLSDDDEGKTVKVRVFFTDDEGNAETLTSEATAAVGAAAEEVVWESELTVGRELQVFPDALGYSVSGDHGGSLTPDHFEIDGSVYSVQFLLHFAEGLWLGIDRELPVEFTLLAGESIYEGSESKVPVTGIGSGGYWWPLSISSWSEDESVQVSLSIQPQEPMGSREKAPLIANLRDIPPGHDGQTTFTFELRFSEEPEPDFSYKTLRDSAFTVTGGRVENARRLNKPSNIRWEITVRPDGNGEVTIILPATTDCEAEGAICAGDGRMLFNRIELTVGGPGG